MSLQRTSLPLIQHSSLKSAVAYPRIEKRIQQVDREIDHDEEHGDEQNESLNHRVIAAGDGLDEKLADAIEVENLFCYDETADQKCELEADDRDNRQQGVAHRMAGDDQTFLHTFGAGGTY